MPGIGVEMCEMSRILRNKTVFMDGETKDHVQSIQTLSSASPSQQRNTHNLFPPDFFVNILHIRYSAGRVSWGF